MTIPSIAPTPTTGASSSGPLDAPAIAAQVARQPLFRVEGAGPVATRDLVGANPVARALLERDPAIEPALRGILRLVEHAAGGPAASRAVQVEGIGLATGSDGHALNLVAAHANSDDVFLAQYARTPAHERDDLLVDLHAQSRATGDSARAMVASGWLLADASLTRALLDGHGGSPTSGDAVAQADAALAVRILRHEAQHLVDPSRPQLGDPAAEQQLREALAEAHSTTLPALRSARDVLGLRAVGDDALLASLAVRPNPAAEQALSRLAAAAGARTPTAAAGLLGEPAERVAAALVAGIARRGIASGEAGLAAARAQVVRQLAAGA